MLHIVILFQDSTPCCNTFHIIYHSQGIHDSLPPLSEWWFSRDLPGSEHLAWRKKAESEFPSTMSHRISKFLLCIHNFSSLKYILKKKCRERNHPLSSSSYFQMEDSWKHKKKHKIQGILCPFPAMLKARVQRKWVDEGRFVLGATSETHPCPFPLQVPLHNRHKALDAECPSVCDNSPFTREEQAKPKWAKSSLSIKATLSEKRWILVVGNSSLNSCLIFMPNILSEQTLLREVFYLSGAQVKDITSKLPSLV